MKAIQFDKYGPAHDVVYLREINKPIPKENQVLIKIKCTTINDYDWSLVRGKPMIYRLMFGLLKPKNKTPGMELSGVVEDIGPNVQNFIIGDEVVGDISEFGFGTMAEYICINEKAILEKPSTISFEEASTLPHAACLAWQALVNHGNIQLNQKILINGGGGGVGTIALQISKLYDCEVTGVDSIEKLGMMQSIGYDYVLDYRQKDFTKTNNEYDIILDCKTNRGPISYLRSLSPNGIYVSIGGNLLKLLYVVLWGKLFSIFTSKKLKLLALKANKDLNQIFELHKQKKIKTIIDGPYSLDETAHLIQYFGEGKHQGKIVIKL